MTEIYRVFNSLYSTVYIGPFRNVINTGTKSDYFDIQVGEAFVKGWRRSQGGAMRRASENIYSLTKDIQRIFEFDDLQINPSENNETLKVMINGKSFNLNEVGSGLTQFILVLANAALRRPAYILLDEPELNLHPSLQLDFLTTLASYASEGIIFSTHCIGLAQAAADRIYSFRKIAEGHAEVTSYEDTPRLAEFVGELSFSGYRELGFDTILLVEGRTDIKTVHQFLRLLKKNHRIVVLNLRGAESINGSSESALELEEITRLSKSIYALIDSERDGEGSPLEANRQAFLETCNSLDIECHVLGRRAIDNYLCERAVKLVKGPLYRQLGPYERLKDASPTWSKKFDNWRIAREMTLDELMANDLGEFLNSL